MRGDTLLVEERRRALTDLVITTACDVGSVGR